MAVTYGFYNSLNGDRTYNAEQMSSIFDGIITDGVFSAIGDGLMTVSGTGMQVIVKTGKCWFNSTWTLNDAAMTLPIDTADVSLTRIDAVIVEINSAISTRANSIKILKGTPSANPAKPTLAADEDLHQYALAYVTVPAGATAITASNIEVNVGKTGCPFITSVLQQTDITDLFNQWGADFNAWFDDIQSQLEGDVATNLQNQINQLKKDVRIGTTAQSQYGVMRDLPNDFIEWIGKYNEHWWMTTSSTIESRVVNEEIRADAMQPSEYMWMSSGSYIYWSKTVTLGTNSISLENPETIKLSSYANSESGARSAASKLVSNAPLYFYAVVGGNTYDMMYLPLGSTYGKGSAYTIGYQSDKWDDWYLITGTAVTGASVVPQIVTVQSHTEYTQPGDPIYVHSMNRNTYPDSGQVGTMTYEYLGRPFQNFQSLAAKMEVCRGSYTGTGTYGSAAPTIINLNFEPEFMIILGMGDVSSAIHGMVLFQNQVPLGNIYLSPGSNLYYCSARLDGLSFGRQTSFYGSDAVRQLNAPGGTYVYAALGKRVIS